MDDEGKVRIRIHNRDEFWPALAAPPFTQAGNRYTLPPGATILYRFASGAESVHAFEGVHARPPPAIQQHTIRHTDSTTRNLRFNGEGWVPAEHPVPMDVFDWSSPEAQLWGPHDTAWDTLEYVEFVSPRKPGTVVHSLRYLAGRSMQSTLPLSLPADLRSGLAELLPPPVMAYLGL